MKIIQVSNSDGGGGAGIAARRYHNALKNKGIDSILIVSKKTSSIPSIIGPRNRIDKMMSIVYPYIEQKLLLRLYGYKSKSIFSMGFIGSKWILKEVFSRKPDIIHIHWINGGTLSINQICKLTKLNIPIIITMHDSWFFTGGCHFQNTCNKFISGCYNCETLNSSRKDLSTHLAKKKAQILNNKNITFISPSSWLKEEAEKSKIFNNFPIHTVHCIANGLDTLNFKGAARNTAREILNLNNAEKVLLFGAPASTKDKRKGWDLLLSALNISSNWDRILVFGSGDSSLEIDPRIYKKIHFLGSFSDELSLSIIYSSADVMLVPSRQESFGLTALEALACGTPVVAFNATGLKDIVIHKDCGYLAEPYSVDDFAAGIDWVLSQKTDVISQRARERAVSTFSMDIIVKQYIDIYKKILSK